MVHDARCIFAGTAAVLSDYAGTANGTGYHPLNACVNDRVRLHISVILYESRLTRWADQHNAGTEGLLGQLTGTG